MSYHSVEDCDLVTYVVAQSINVIQFLSTFS